MQNRFVALLPVVSIALVTLHCGGGGASGSGSGGSPGATGTGGSSTSASQGGTGGNTSSSAGTGGGGAGSSSVGTGGASSSSGTGGASSSSGTGGAPFVEMAFSTVLSGNQNEDVVAVATAPDGTIWLAGRATKASGPAGVDVDFDLGGGVVVHGPFLARLSSDGVPLAGVSIANISPNGLDLDLTTDANGNAIIAGRFQNNMMVGATPLVSAGSVDGFVAKVDPSGAVVFARAFGSAAAENDADVAVDANGNVVVAMPLAGPADFGGGLIGAAGDIAVARYTPNGTFTSAHVAVAGASAGFLDLAVDSGSNAIITHAPFGMTPGKVNKVSPQGNTIFAAVITAQNLPLRAVGVLGNDDIVVAGQLTGFTTVAGSFLMPQNLDGILIRLGPTGAELAAKLFGGPSSVAQPHWLRVSKNDDIVVSGATNGSIDFGAGPVVATNAFWFRWTESFGYVQAITGKPIGLYEVSAESVSTLVAASIAGPLDLGNGIVTPPMPLDIGLSRVLAP